MKLMIISKSWNFLDKSISIFDQYLEQKNIINNYKIQFNQKNKLNKNIKNRFKNFRVLNHKIF